MWNHQHGSNARGQVDSIYVYGMSLMAISLLFISSFMGWLFSQSQRLQVYIENKKREK